MLRAIFYTVAFLAIQLVVSLIFNFAVPVLQAYGVDLSSHVVMFISVVLSSLLTIAVFLLLRWSTVTRSYLLSRPYFILFWVVLAALGALIPSMLLQELMPALPPVLQEIVDQTTEQMSSLMDMRGGYFLIALLVPLAEEIVFRGAVLRSLLRWKPDLHWPMIAVSALLFALAHGNPAQMIHAFLTGLLLGWLYYRTGSIIPGVVYHIANNTVAYILYKLYPDPDLELSDLLGNSQRTIGAAVIFSLFIFLPALYQLNQRMKRVREDVS